MKRNYLVVYEKGRKHFSGFAPDLPGCASAGKSLDGMRANMKQAMEGWLEVSADFGDPLPEPKTESITLPIEGELDPKTTYVVEFLSVHLPKKRRAAPRASKHQKLVAA